MKTFIGAVALVIVMWVAVNSYESTPTEYVKEETTLEVVEEIVEVDAIEKARIELERINNELDIKEQELLEERKAIDAELERLRQTRVSFQ